MMPCPTPWAPAFCPKEGTAKAKIPAAVAAATKPTISRCRTSTLPYSPVQELANESDLRNSAFARGGAESLPGGGQRDGARVTVLSPVLGQGAADDDFIAFLHGVLLPA